MSQAAAGGDPSSAFSELFQNSNQAWIDYIGPDIDTAPIVTLAEDVSSWEVGDQIVVGATNYDSRETETFTLVDCPECTANQVKVDRPPSYTHWGRKGQLKLFLQILDTKSILVLVKRPISIIEKRLLPVKLLTSVPMSAFYPEMLGFTVR